MSKLVYQLNIIKKIKTDYKRKVAKILSYEEKEKMWQYARELYKNLSEDTKQKLVEYRKKY